MPPVLSHSTAAPSTSQPVRRDASRPAEQDQANFSLRDSLADMTVRETSFSEFLAALKQAGKKPV